VRAWLLTEFGKPFELTELDDPTVGAGEVKVEVKAAGLCTSDLHIMDGTLVTEAQPPVIMGHEIAGVITEIGSGVEGFAVGDRVGIDPVASGVTGPDARTGGGYGQYTLAKPHELIKMPDAVSFVQAAAATDAGSTAHHAVVGTGGVSEGMRVGIIGLGGLGLTGATIAVLRGATVYAADVNERVFEPARAAGVTEVFHEASEFAGLELDVIIDFAGFGTTTAAAIETVKVGGKVVQVGLGAPNITFPSYSLVSRQVTLVGSLGGSVADTAALYELIATTSFSMATSEVSFEEVPEGLERMRRGEIKGERLVAVY
jgi:propanol-preferring alcohol dehydrogenase